MQSQYQQENIRLHDMLEQKMKVITQLRQKNQANDKALELYKEENKKLSMLNYAYKENMELNDQTHEALLSMVKTFIVMTLNEEYTKEERTDFAQGLSELTMFRDDLKEIPENKKEEEGEIPENTGSPEEK